ncbi:MFS general substrate transporter [Rhizodiscina lignyota]|uniref:MFS general substrate transporter n=1 Tax=Rhizodiscina lignyota TaxID=1504668 RepID=A0A9P4M4H3_9PEZI|nr:MFS general substrate transporter [Rhizodiscina lignyota]
MVDERTPLIPAPTPAELLQANGKAKIAPATNDTENNNEEEEDVPLPKVQIFLLCYARLIEPIAFFSIFPFINQMIFETGGIKESDVGFWSGLIESLFSLTQMFLMVPWGRAADRFGRKPTLVFSLWGVAVATALFGFSVNVWQMVVFRCVAGIFAGTVVTVRAMITENSTPKTQARAFSFFAFASNFGIFVGPLIGGVLAKPAEVYPRVFGHVQLFKDFPYALPTLVTGLFGASAALVCTLFVKETLKGKKEGEEAPKPMSAWEIIKAPGVLPVLALYSTIMLLALAYTAIIPVFWFTDLELGGYGFSPQLISAFLGLGGLAQAMWLLFIFPPLQHRIGTGGIIRICGYAWPFFFAGWPLGYLLLKHNLKVAFWIIVPPCLVIGSGIAMSFTAIQLSLNDISPSSSAFGTLNALALAMVSGIRAFAPVLFSSLYALGVRSQWIGGQLIWLVLLALAFLNIVAMGFLPEKAEGRPKKQTTRRFDDDE